MHKAIDPKGYGIAKGKANALQALYEPFFAPLVGQSISLLELGVHKGASLRFWRDYFENATIVGLDYNPPVRIDDPKGKIHIYQGYQQDIQLLDRIVKEQAPDGFDVVIDDCSHIGRFARISFWHLFQNHLKPGWLYDIEDWETGYHYSWPDGKRYKPTTRLKYTSYERFMDRLGNKLSGPLPNFPRLQRIRSKIRSKLFVHAKVPSHIYGMVGFVKELLDAYALGERAIPRSGPGRYFDYGISQLHIHGGIVIASKSRDKDVNKFNAYLSKDGDLTPLALRLISEEDDFT
jgi:hypothetical protein